MLEVVYPDLTWH